MSTMNSLLLLILALAGFFIIDLCLKWPAYRSEHGSTSHFRRFFRAWAKKGKPKFAIVGGGAVLIALLLLLQEQTLPFPKMLGANLSKTGGMSTLLILFLLFVTLGGFLTINLSLKWRSYRGRHSSTSSFRRFLRTWTRKNRIRLAIVGGVTLFILLALFQQYTLVLPDLLGWAKLPKSSNFSTLFVLMLLFVGLGGFLTIYLSLQWRDYRSEFGSTSQFRRFLQVQAKKSKLKFAFVGGVTLIIVLALIFQDYTLVIPDPWGKTKFPKPVRWGLTALVTVSLYMIFDLFMTWRTCRLSSKSSRPSGFRFFRWWFRSGALKFCAVGMVTFLAGGALWGVRYYNLYQFKSESSRYMVNARRYYLLSKYPEATLELRNAIRQNRGDFDANLWLARSYWRMGSLAEARAAYREAIRIEPKLYAAHLELGSLALSQRDAETVLVEVRQARILAPEAPEPRLLLAQLYSATNKREQALEECRAIMGKEFASPEIRLQFLALLMEHRAYGELLQAANAGLKITPNDEKFTFAQAQALEQLGRSGEAETALRATAMTHPVSPEPYIALADLMIRRKDYVSALYDYGEVLKRASDNERAMNNFACLNAEYGFDMERSAALAARLYGKYPQDDAVADTLGWTFLRMGKVDQALPLLQQAATGTPGNPAHHYHLGVALIRNGNPTAGRKELSEALKISSDFVGVERVRELLRRR